ncbi:hypothetical protein FCL40_11905 [Ferrimonas sediminicola]|uniref:Uncharacterized protein n=1 Tax=Ferrimonas sediminicola TaxID=2569538 RepID=A0A4U1BDM2_9GAMM|nr:hypothetical protein [Ferrimonas sediminicola]TKB48409.1 hypothetical protein FCL40_11905 [Ferrimonas sediminicola]
MTTGGLQPGDGIKPVYHYCRQAGCIFRGSYQNRADAEAYLPTFHEANPGLLVDPINREGNLVITYLNPQVGGILDDRFDGEPPFLPLLPRGGQSGISSVSADST